MNSHPAKGYLYVIAAAVLWASCGTVGKILFNSGMTPVDLVQIRVTLSSILLFVFLGLFQRQSLRIRLKDVGYFLLLGSVAMALLQLSYFYAISRINVAAAILLEYLAPGLVAIYSMYFWHERVTAIKLLSLAMAIGGCYLVVGGYDLDLLRMNHVGIMWGLLSAVVFGGYTLLGERGMRRYPPWTITFYAFVFASLTLNIIHSPFYGFTIDYSMNQWLILLYVVIGGTILPSGLYFMGIDYIRSTKSVITATLEPISAAVMAFFLLGEVFEGLQIIGGVSVIAAIILLQLQREQDTLSPELLRLKQNQQAKGIQR
ncbi:MAG TPA: EamA family transporter [Syntrophales bacterium]|nr:EamA family transporter [Syntrophales bacterium]